MTARIAAAQLTRFGFLDDGINWDTLTVMQSDWHAAWAENFETFLHSRGKTDASISRAFPIADTKEAL